jgi:hypothetical protein
VTNFHDRPSYGRCMKRILLAFLVLSSLLLAACATTPATPDVRGVISSIEGNTIGITPADGGQAATVTVGWGTRVFHPNGLEAQGTGVLAVGQPVHVWLAKGTQNATRVNIAQ